MTNFTCSRGRRRRLVSIVFTIALVSLSLTACGSTNTELPPGVVAEVGHTPITNATLKQWMTAMLGGDYYEITNRTAPAALLSPPPDHASCVAELERVSTSAGARKVTHSQIETLCAELYEAIKAQALTYLIRSQANVVEAAAHGVSVSEKQVEGELARVRAEQFPTKSGLQTYLTQRHLTLAIELFVLKQDIIGREYAPKLYAAVLKGGGGEKAGRERLIASETKWVNETNCRPGYVVARCRQYPSFKPGVSDQNYAGASPAHLLFEIGRLEPATSHHFTGHGGTKEDLECREVAKHLACTPVSKKQSEEVQRRAALRRTQG